jgi:squalene synthase HpnC
MQYLAPRQFLNPEKALARTWTVGEAEKYCRWLTNNHYENFHIVSFLLPRHLHQDFHNVYAFCRWADDLGDEIGNTTESIRLLAWWRDELHAMFAGKVRHPVFVALARTVERRELPLQPFDDLITAFVQDQTITRYQDWEEVFEYCRFSANPVGRLVLALCGYQDAMRQQLSDYTCTALQLANFWQDVAVDLKKGRIYIPLAVMHKHGYTVSELQSLRFNDSFREVMKEIVGMARELFQKGLPLAGLVDRRLALDIRLFSLGGMRILDKIADQDYNVLARRPAIGRAERLRLLVGTLVRTALQRAA